MLVVLNKIFKRVLRCIRSKIPIRKEFYYICKDSQLTPKSFLEKVLEYNSKATFHDSLRINFIKSIKPITFTALTLEDAVNFANENRAIIPPAYISMVTDSNEHLLNPHNIFHYNLCAWTFLKSTKIKSNIVSVVHASDIESHITKFSEEEFLKFIQQTHKINDKLSKQKNELWNLKKAVNKHTIDENVFVSCVSTKMTSEINLGYLDAIKLLILNSFKEYYSDKSPKFAAYFEVFAVYGLQLNSEYQYNVSISISSFRADQASDVINNFKEIPLIYKKFNDKFNTFFDDAFFTGIIEIVAKQYTLHEL